MPEPRTFSAQDMTYAVIITIEEPLVEIIGPVHTPTYPGEFLVMGITRRREYAEVLQTALEWLYTELGKTRTPEGLPVSFQVIPVAAAPPKLTRELCPWYRDDYE